MTLKVEMLEKNDLSLSFKVSDVSPQFVNLLRRVMISRIPTLAIDDVIIIENSSIMFDEMLAHRLGLIPIRYDMLNTKEDTTAYFKCEVEAKEGDLVVYSKDLIPSDPNIKPAYETIPIVKLAKGQKVSFEAIARVKTGSEHARFQPVSVCTYKQLEDEKSFIFSFESTGVDLPEKILLKGIEVILNTYENINKKLNELKDDKANRTN
jgi:DNA-directed RNA polymerase subunit D